MYFSYIVEEADISTPDMSKTELLRPKPSRWLNGGTVPLLTCLSTGVVNHRRSNMRPGEIPYMHMKSGVVIYCSPVTDLGQTTVLFNFLLSSSRSGSETVTAIHHCHLARLSSLRSQRKDIRVDHVPLEAVCHR